MSQSVTKEKIEKRSKVAIWFNDLFRTKLEIETDKLLEMMRESNDNEIGTSSQYFYKRTGLEKAVEEELEVSPQYVKLTSLTVTYWCDVPKKLWREFERDPLFAAQLHERVNSLTNRLVDEWAKRQIHWERIAAKASEEGDQQRVETAKAEFAEDCETLRKECEVVAIEDIAQFFTERALVLGDYKRYKVKAGVKLAFTFVGLVITIASLSTAATPAAPATLVPALVTIVNTVVSAGKQIRDLHASAEEIEKEIQKGVQKFEEKIEATYKDKKGKPKKATFAMSDLVKGLSSSLTGGVSDIGFPSVKSLMDLTDTHNSKLDGLEGALHEMGIALDSLVTVMEHAEKVLADNKEALKSARGEDAKKIEEIVEESEAEFKKVRDEFYHSFDHAIPEMSERVESGRRKNKEFQEALKEINNAVGSKDWAIAGKWLGFLVMTALGFVSGAPSDFAEKVTEGLSLTCAVLDRIRALSPAIMKKALEEPST